MFAYDHRLPGVFWTMLGFFLWVIWLMLLFGVIGNIFRQNATAPVVSTTHV